MANDATGDRPPHQAHGTLSLLTLRINLSLTDVQFDERKGATWHCIVGRNFGSFVTHGWPSETPFRLFTLALTSHHRDEALHLLLPRTLRYSAL